MRCAICGGEIDSETKRCTGCGECWGGGNRGVAQEASRETDLYYREIAPPSFTERCISAVGNALRSADRFASESVGKAASAVGLKTDSRQNRFIAYGTVLLIIALAVVLPIVFVSSCAEQGIEGTWVNAGSAGNVSMEFSSDGEVTMYVLSGDTQKVYRSGAYSVEGSLLKINYNDGESVTLTYRIEKDTAVFTLLSTGESQTYKRK